MPVVVVVVVHRFVCPPRGGGWKDIITDLPSSLRKLELRACWLPSIPTIFRPLTIIPLPKAPLYVKNRTIDALLQCFGPRWISVPTCLTAYSRRRNLWSGLKA